MRYRRPAAGTLPTLASSRSMARFKGALAEPDKLRKARAKRAKGIGIVKVAKQVGLGVGIVAKRKREMVGARETA